jgi:hypothetical protein
LGVRCGQSSDQRPLRSSDKLDTLDTSLSKNTISWLSGCWDAGTQTATWFSREEYAFYLSDELP